MSCLAWSGVSATLHVKSSDVFWKIPLSIARAWGKFVVRPNFQTFVSSYGSGINSSKWQSLADFDENGIIGLTDLVSIAKLYGQRVWMSELPPATEP